MTSRSASSLDEARLAAPRRRRTPAGDERRQDRRTDLLGKGRLLPEGAGRFLKRRLSELGGAGLIALAGGLVLALATYAAQDPSWNTATAGGPVRNALGLAGSHVADVLVQSLGVAAYLIAALLAGWGVSLASHRPVTAFPWRLLSGLGAVLVTAAMLAEAGQGGVAGDRLLGGLAGLSGSAVPPGLLALVLGATALLLLLGGLGVGTGDAAAVLRDALARLRPGKRAGATRRATSRVAGGPSDRRSPDRPFPRRPLVDEPASDGSADGRHPGDRHSGGPLAVRLGGWVAGMVGGVAGLARRSAVRARDGMQERLRRPPQLDPDPLPAGIDPEPEADPTPRRPLAATNAGPVAPVARPPEPPVEEPRKPRLTAVVAPRAKPPEPARNTERARQAALDLDPDGPDAYELPPVDLLQQAPPTRADEMDAEALQRNAALLEGVLEDFGVKGEIVKVSPGPVVTLYELEPAPGTKSSRVIGLADDIARSMSAISVRVAVVPGRNVIGIEMPNRKRETVYLRELLEAEVYGKTQAKLALVLGKDIGGGPVIADLARMPHLLVAGTTGSGKSVAINTMILSLLYRLPPDKCRFIMVDPKMLELSIYEGIPHLLAPVVTDPKKAVVALKWAVREMEDRYRAMSKVGVRNIDGYNARLREAREAGEILTRKVQTGFDPDTGKPIFEEQPIDLTELPYIVVIVDEMADLMLVAGKDIEAAIQRLAQMARAAGIHLIMATQRPSVDVITGTIKANFPTRISFQVTSKIDSRTILGEQGAEQLLGQGDMLYMAGGGRITRVHGPFVRDEEVEDVVKFLKAQGVPQYVDAVTEEEEEFDPDAADGDGGGSGGAATGDDIYDQAVALVTRERKASTSFIQRHLRIGYNSAARLIERMEKEGVVSRANHVGKREVLARDVDDVERVN